LEGAGIDAFGFAWRTGVAFLVGRYLLACGRFYRYDNRGQIELPLRRGFAEEFERGRSDRYAWRCRAGFPDCVVLSLIGVTIIFLRFMASRSHPESRS